MVIQRYIKWKLTTLKNLDPVNTPTYLLAKYLNPILSPLTTNEFTVKNSFDFAEEVVNYDHNLYMASLDVESLFTNIPLEETIKNCVNDLFSNNFYSGKLSRKDLYELLKLATTESSFIFDNKLYKQIDGVAMVSPFSAIMKKFDLMNVLSLNLWFQSII